MLYVIKKLEGVWWYHGCYDTPGQAAKAAMEIITYAEDAQILAEEEYARGRKTGEIRR